MGGGGFFRVLRFGDFGGKKCGINTHIEVVEGFINQVEMVLFAFG